MASSGSGDVRWIVNQMPTKNKLGYTYSIAKEIANPHWEADCRGSNPPIKSPKALDEVSLFEASIRYSTDGQRHQHAILYTNEEFQ
jgi:hypothetical protein